MKLYLVVVVAVVVVADALVVKSATTRVVVVAVKEQSPLPVHTPPAQPVKVEVVAAAAVRLTELPATTFSLQSRPQLKPVPVTVPSPVPCFCTVIVWVKRKGLYPPPPPPPPPPPTTGFLVKEAMTAESCVGVKVQRDTPEQCPPDQPVKVESDAGAAVRVSD